MDVGLKVLEILFEVEFARCWENRFHFGKRVAVFLGEIALERKKTFVKKLIIFPPKTSSFSKKYPVNGKIRWIRQLKKRSPKFRRGETRVF